MFSALPELSPERSLGHATMFVWISETANKTPLGMDGWQLVLKVQNRCQGTTSKLLQNLPHIWIKMFSWLPKLSPERSLGHAIMFVWMSETANKTPLGMNGWQLGLKVQNRCWGWANILLQNLPDIWMKMCSALPGLSPETSLGHALMFVWMSEKTQTKLHWAWMGGIVV